MTEKKRVIVITAGGYDPYVEAVVDSVDTALTYLQASMEEASRKYPKDGTYSNWKTEARGRTLPDVVATRLIPDSGYKTVECRWLLDEHDFLAEGGTFHALCRMLDWIRTVLRAMFMRGWLGKQS